MIIEGSNQCYNCNYTINWVYQISQYYKVEMIPSGIKAISCVLIDKDKFRVTCKCPKCNITNEFIHQQ